MLPLILVSLLLMLWAGLLLHSQISLNSAMMNGLRLAATRGVAERAGSIQLSDLQKWKDGYDPTERLKVVLTTNRIADWDEALAILNNWSQDNFGRDFRNLPLEWQQTLIYVQEAARISIGEAVRYPCDPASNSDDSIDCLLCQIVSEDSLTPGGGQPPRNTGRTAISCAYQPNNLVLNFFLGLLSTITGDRIEPRLLIRRTTFFDLPKAPWESE